MSWSRSWGLGLGLSLSLGQGLCLDLGLGLSLVLGLGLGLGFDLGLSEVCSTTLQVPPGHAVDGRTEGLKLNYASINFASSTTQV